MKRLSLCFLTASSLLFPVIASADIPPREKREVQREKTKTVSKTVEAAHSDTTQDLDESSHKPAAPSGAPATDTHSHIGTAASVDAATGAPQTTNERPAQETPQRQREAAGPDQSDTPETGNKGCSVLPDSSSATGLAFLLIAAGGLRRRHQQTKRTSPG